MYDRNTRSKRLQLDIHLGSNRRRSVSANTAPTFTQVRHDPDSEAGGDAQTDAEDYADSHEPWVHAEHRCWESSGCWELRRSLMRDDLFRPESVFRCAGLERKASD